MRYMLLPLLLVFAAATTYAQVSEAGDVYSDSKAIEINEEYELYGEPMPDVMEKFRVGEAISQWESLMGVELQISGSVVDYRNTEACFVILEDGGKRLTVTLVDPHAPMPSSVMGRDMTVFGTLEALDKGRHPQIPPPPGSAEKVDAPKSFRILARSIRLNK